MVAYYRIGRLMEMHQAEAVRREHLRAQRKSAGKGGRR